MTVIKKKWGEKIAENKKLTADFNSSFIQNLRLFSADIFCSAAYCEGLFHAGVLTRLESEKLKNGLLTLLKRSEFDRNYFDETSASDIHSFIETKLVQLVGESGRKLQIGRSRYDQTATAFRYWLRREIEEISTCCVNLQFVLIEKAEVLRESILPAYNELKKMQPISWAHWCMAYFEMFSRDLERLEEVWRRTNILTLGSGYAAGSNYEIDRESIAKDLGFEGITANSFDAVSDYDFAVEFASAGCLTMIHLSRFASDLLLFATEEFNFVELDNPDHLNHHGRQNQNSLELIRGMTARVIGQQTVLLSTLKGIQLGVGKEFQEIIKAVFDVCDILKSCLQISTETFQNLRIKEDNSRRAAENSYLNATEITDYFIQKGLNFNQSVELSGKIISKANSTNKKILDLNIEDLRQISPLIEVDIFEFLKLEQNLNRKNQIGGTSPERVFDAINEAKKSLENE